MGRIRNCHKLQDVLLLLLTVLIIPCRWEQSVRGILNEEISEENIENILRENIGRVQRERENIGIINREYRENIDRI